MTRYRVPPGCKGLDMADGTHYNARGGIVSIDRSDHIRALRKSQVSRVYDQVSDAVLFRGAGRDCPRCAFGLWAWQTTCPRCGTPLTEEAA